MWDILYTEEDVNTLDIIRSRLVLAATPTEDILSRMYYHGTTKVDNARKIFTDGIQPQTIENPRRMMAPVQGRTYITDKVSYAAIYAYGADGLGHTTWKSLLEKYGRYGYVFKIDNSSFVDVLPDEDSIGELVCTLLRPTQDIGTDNIWTNINSLHWLKERALKLCSAVTMTKIKNSEYASWAQAGKKILKSLSDDEAIQLIRKGAHVSHAGTLQIDSCWRIDRTRSAEYKSDGSNFFDKAFEVKSVSDIL
jgi:hypothetical protein